MPKLSDAQRCRKNGWTVGTRLRGIESGENWSREVTIQITAIGEENILAKMVKEEGMTFNGVEDSWTLSDRRWRRV